MEKLKLNYFLLNVFKCEVCSTWSTSVTLRNYKKAFLQQTKKAYFQLHSSAEPP